MHQQPITLYKLAKRLDKILGIKIGRLNPKTIWKDVLENLRAQKLSITVPFQTWQAKSLLAKAKLLPQLTFTART